jgi:signal recognition particle subunit SRP54
VLDQLSQRLQDLFKQLRGHGKLTEDNVTDACRQLRMALLEADVAFDVARSLVDRIKVRAMDVEVLQSITPGQQMVKVFHDELVDFLGVQVPMAAGSPLRLLLCGLQGSGKTTTAAKLALWFRKQGRHPLMVACDLQRPAAITQLEALGRQLNIPVFAKHDSRDPIAVASAALQEASVHNYNVILFDTAGRLDIDEALQKELTALHSTVRPQETWFVADAALGQKAVDITTRFKTSVPLTGLILTRLDGDARGGAALSIREITGVPIRFLGTGEKPDQLEVMDARRLAGRILGMGDIVGLVEKAQEIANIADAERMEQRLRRNQWDMEDFLGQLQLMKKLGPLENVLGMIPGLPKLEDSGRAEAQMRRTEAIILSMTPKERRNPDVLNARRRQRIARGSGTTVTAVNELLTQFNTMKKMMKSPGRMKKMLSSLGIKA